jgi:hypothetical protein
MQPQFYVFLFYLIGSLVAVLFAPSTFDKPFLVAEALSYMVVGTYFLVLKTRRHGSICFDMFFVPSFFLINYAHAAFIYPHDEFLPAFRFATRTHLITYAVAVAQVGIACYFFFSSYFERDVPEASRYHHTVPPAMAVNRITCVCLIATSILFAYVFIFRAVQGYKHIYPRLMTVILTLIALSWYYQAQLLAEGERGWKVMLRYNKYNILSALLFFVTMLSVGSRGQVLFLFFMLLPLINHYYFHIRLRILVPFVAVGVVVMALVMLTRGTDHNIFQANIGEVVEYGAEVLLESPDVFWMLLTDFVVNAKTLYESIDYTQVNGIIWGRSYIVYLFVFIPFGGSVLVKLLTGLDGQNLFSGYILTEYAEADYGLGTNLIADLYLNFSLPGVIIMMSLLGYMVTHFEKPISKYGAFLYLSFFANCIYMVRGDIFCWLTFFVYFVIFDWLMRLRIQNASEPAPPVS